MSENNYNKDKKNGPKKPFPGMPGDSDKKPFNFYWVYAIIAALLLGYLFFNEAENSKEITYSEFLGKIEQGKVEKVILHNIDYADVFLKEDGKVDTSSTQKNQPQLFPQKKNNVYFVNLLKGRSTVDDIEELSKKYHFELSNESPNEMVQTLLSYALIFGVMIFIWVMLMKRMGGGAGGGGQIFNIGKSKAKLFEKGKGTNVTFQDVAGLEGAKEEVEEIVDFLKNPKKYTALGAKIPKGALLVGPPGTGKTLLAKAVAGEAKVPFFSLSGSDFVEMFVGVGASRVRDLFKQAKEKAPAIIFIDEIDAIGRARGKNGSFSSNDERENTLNQLLTEMDGFGTNSGVIILAATNRADVLDKALMRAGRFDRQIFVDMPDLPERKEIFEVHLKPIKNDDSVDIDFLAKQTPGFSGADIANLCNEAALIAARKKQTTVTKQDFLDAVDRIVGGLEKKNKIITPREKETIAFHESGHAVVSWIVQYASPLVKVTIVPRGRSLGAAWYLPEERQLNSVEQILDEMCTTLGGRAAEELIFNRITTGALNDLEKVTKQAYAMVTVYGFNEEIGNISFYDSRGEQSFTKPYSEKTAEKIDQEVKKIVDEQYERAKKILLENKDKLTALATKLLEDEVIFKEDLIKIIGDREKFTTELVLDHSKAKKNGAAKEETSEETPKEENLPEATSETGDYTKE